MKQRRSVKWAFGATSIILPALLLGESSCGGDEPSPIVEDGAARTDTDASSDGPLTFDAPFTEEGSAVDVGLCAQLVAAASSCSSDESFHKCSVLVGCSSLRTELVRHVYACAIDSGDVCGTGSDRCSEELAAEHAGDPGFATYRQRCIGRHSECSDAGAPFFDSLCGPPDGDPIHAFYRDDVYRELAECLARGCDEIVGCFTEGIACR